MGAVDPGDIQQAVGYPDATLVAVLLRQHRPLSRLAFSGLWPAGPVAAPGPSNPCPTRECRDRGHFPERPARVRDAFSREQQSAQRGGDRAVSGLKVGGLPTSLQIWNVL